MTILLDDAALLSGTLASEHKRSSLHSHEIMESDAPALPLAASWSARPKYLPRLDGLRGLAILQVLLFHWVMIGVAPTRIDRLVQKITATGWSGVDLFFVLSGFLITGILLDSKTQPNYLRNFYVRRALRIVPLNYALLVLFLFVLPLLAPAIDARFGTRPAFSLPYWLYLSNFANLVYSPGAHKPLGALWSLAMEEQFYLVWPLVVLLLRPRTLGRLCLALAVAAPLLRIVLVARGAGITVVNNLTLSHIDGLVLGSYLAIAQQAGILKRFRVAAWAMLLIVPLGLLILNLAGGKLEENRVFLVTGYSAVSLGFCGLLVLTLQSAAPTRLFSLHWLRWLGRRSYALYLFNIPIMIAIQNFWFDPQKGARPGHSILPRIFVFCILCSIASICLAGLTWHLLEKPFLRLKVYFPMHHPAIALPSQREPEPIEEPQQSGECELVSAS